MPRTIIFVLLAAPFLRESYGLRVAHACDRTAAELSRVPFLSARDSCDSSLGTGQFRVARKPMAERGGAPFCGIPGFTCTSRGAPLESRRYGISK